MPAAPTTPRCSCPTRRISSGAGACFAPPAPPGPGAGGGGHSADIVIADINPHMPRSHGDAQVKLDQFAHVVYTDHPLPEKGKTKQTPEAAEIGRLVAELIPDGATLQAGIGAVPSAILRALTGHHDLGIHSELISDEMVDLIQAGVITNTAKSVDPGLSVAAFALGTKKLFDFIHDNPAVHLRGSDYTNNPAFIKHQDRMVAINAAIEIDLSGQVCAESIGPYLFSGVGGQVDFLRGAALAKDGMPIIALPSTARGGSTSRITPMLGMGAAVTTSRSLVHWVVTEHGAVNLHGLSLRERAEALISLAHPDFRTELKRWNRRGMAMIFPGFYSQDPTGAAPVSTAGKPGKAGRAGKAAKPAELAKPANPAEAAKVGKGSKPGESANLAKPARSAKPPEPKT